MEQQNVNNQNGKSNFSKEQIISSPFDLLARSFKVYQAGFVDLLKMILIPVLGMIPLGVVIILYGGSVFIFKDFPTARVITLAILAILAILAFAIMIYVGISGKIGIYRLIKNRLESTGEGEVKSVKSIFNESKKDFWKFIVVSFLVGLFVLLWTLLFVVPGIIYGVYYSFAIWAFISEGKESTSALKRSKELVKGHWWSVVWRFIFLGIAYMIFVIVISIPLAILPDNSAIEPIWDSIINIISFVISPLMLIYNYFIYRDLIEIKGGQNK